MVKFTHLCMFDELQHFIFLEGSVCIFFNEVETTEKRPMPERLSVKPGFLKHLCRCASGKHLSLPSFLTDSYCLADNIVSLEPYQPKRGERQAGQARLITVQQSRDFLRISDSCHSLNRDCSKRLQKRERNRGVHDGNSALFISQRNTWAI